MKETVIKLILEHWVWVGLNLISFSSHFELCGLEKHGTEGDFVKGYW